jgi:hypothetical protein
MTTHDGGIVRRWSVLGWIFLATTFWGQLVVGATHKGIELSVERADKKPFALGETAETRFHLKNVSDEILVIDDLAPVSNLGEELIRLSGGVYGSVTKLPDRDVYEYNSLSQMASMAFYGVLLFPKEELSVLTRYRPIGSTTEEFRIDYHSLGSPAENKYRIYAEREEKTNRSTSEYVPVSNEAWQRRASAHAEIRSWEPDSSPRAVLIPELKEKPDSLSARVTMQFADDSFPLEKAQAVGKRIAGDGGSEITGYSQALGGYVVSGHEACWVLSSPLQTDRGPLYAVAPPLLFKDADAGEVQIRVGDEQKGEGPKEEPSGRTFWNRYPVYYGDGMYTHGEFLHISGKELKDFLLDLRQHQARLEIVNYFFDSRYFQLVLPAAPTSAGDKLPTWEEMQAVLGKPISDGAVKQFVARFGLKQYQKFDQGGFENYEKTPVSLLYRENKVKRVIVRLSENPGQKWPIYTGTLLLGLQRDDTPGDAIKRLGQPVHQPLPDYLRFRYKTSDLVLTFDQDTHKLAEIDLDAPFRKFNRTEPSAYDKMDEKAIDASMEQLVRKLNAVLPPGWRAARGLATNAAPDPDADQVRISFETPIWKKQRPLPNPPPFEPGQEKNRAKEPPYLNLYLLPKYRQDEATHLFEDCPFLLHDERPDLVSMPEHLNRQYDEALKSTEQVLTKQPEPASDK